MKFGDLSKYKTDGGLVVSPRHERWLEHNSNPEYSTKARVFAAKALIDMGRPRDRRGTISASSLGSCRRKQQFTFLGLPELPPSPKLAQIFQNGTFMHIRWQMAGLTEGWLKEAEVPVGGNDLNLSGTQDGIAYDDTIVELKSCNSNQFARIQTFGPIEGHIYQIGTYTVTTGAEKATLIYENKDTQEFKEFVRTRDELPLVEIANGAEEMWLKNGNEELYEPLDKCWDKEGYQYAGCPFRNQCLKIRNWQEAKEIANQAK
jgi:hypothetical protein